MKMKWRVSLDNGETWEKVTSKTIIDGLEIVKEIRENHPTLEIVPQGYKVIYRKDL